MRSLRRIFLVAVACLHVAVVQPHAQGLEAIGASVAIDGVISSVSSELQEIVRQLESSANRTMMEARTHVLVTAQNLEFLGEQLSGKVFGDLNESQKRAIQSARQLVADFNAGNLETLSRADDTVKSLESAIATLPFSQTFPRVLNYSPSYFVAFGNVSDVQIRVRGSWLGYDDPQLSFGTEPCQTLSKIETLLVFNCPIASLASDNTNMSSGDLVVYQERNWWEQFIGLFSSNKKPTTYRIGVTALPEKIGDFVVVADVEEPVVETRVREQEFRADNDHCWDARGVTWPVNADAVNGWQIDVSAPVVVTNVSVSSKSSVQGVSNLTSASFAVSGTVTNNGSCGPRLPFSSSRAYYDGRGHVHVKVAYTEFREVPGLVAREMASGDLLWSKDVGVALPALSKSFAITVNQIDGRVIVASSPQDYGWFTIDYDPDARRVVMRPNKPDVALNR